MSGDSGEESDDLRRILFPHPAVKHNTNGTTEKKTHHHSSSIVRPGILLGKMEVYLTSENTILITDGDGHSLSFGSRATTSCTSSKSADGDRKFHLIPGPGLKMEDEDGSAVFLGTCQGVIGKFCESKIILVRESEMIGHVPGIRGSQDPIFRISKVAVIDPLTAAGGDVMFTENPPVDLVDLNLIDPPVTDSSSSSFAAAVDENLLSSPHAEVHLTSPSHHHHQQQAKQMMKKTWNQIKSAPGQLRSTMLSPSGMQSSPGSISPSQSFSQMESRERNPANIRDRRIMDQLLKLFNDSQSFYYSPTGDLMNTMQRKYQKKEPTDSCWQHSDDRFFWNKFMLSDLIESSDRQAADHWILPIMQGFVQFEVCPPHESFMPRDQTDSQSVQKDPVMILISRRSRHMAGTRYKRRGIDSAGECANYVETEQLFKYDQHVVSFTQVRGSIPVFWSQVGHSYRPPPKIDRQESETQVAFDLHFDQQLAIYSKQVIVNLIESNGRESVLGQSYLNHILNYDSPDITYVSFDFHEYCRGMRFENVSVLVESLADIIRDMKFCWVDDQGIICEQTSVFRVNCVDCLDRTNVVQTAFAKVALDQQLTRLGLLPPEGCLPSSWKRLFNSMWANNGDILSRQYAGTAALKSDFTRTGERKFSGMVKDGVNSATRYYQNRFKDRTRQAVIDLMLGVAEPEDVEDALDMDPGNLSADESAQQDRIRLVIEDVKKLLIPEHEIVLGSWPLVDAESSINEMDSILILTQESFFVADYDDDTDRVTSCRRTLLEDLTKMELGLEPSSLTHKLKIKAQEGRRCYVLRLFYLMDGGAGYFYAFKSTGSRFFNNMTIPVKSVDDEIESLKAILESFKVALSVKSLNVPVYEGRLEKKRSKLLPNRSGNRAVMTGITNVGSKAMSGVSSQFAKFRGRFRHAAGSHHVSVPSPSDNRSQAEAGEECMTDPMKRGSESEEDPSNYSTSLFVKESDEGSDFSGSNLDDDEIILEEDRELTPTTSAATEAPATGSRPGSRNDSVFLRSCGILTTTSSPPLKSLSDTDIADGCEPHPADIRKANSRVTLHTSVGKESYEEEGEESVFSSLPPILVTGSGNTSPHQQRNHHRKSSGSKMMPPQMQATVSMVNMSEDTGDKLTEAGSSSAHAASVSSAVSCVTLAARKSDPENTISCSKQMNDSEHHHVYSEAQMPPLSPGLSQARSTLLVSEKGRSTLMKNSVSASEMVSLTGRKDLLMSPFNSAASRIAKGVQSLGLNMSSITPSSSVKSSPKKGHSKNGTLNSLADAYDQEKKRKRSSKSRIIEL